VPSRNLGPLSSWNPLGHSRPVTGLLYLYLLPHGIHFGYLGPGDESDINVDGKEVECDEVDCISQAGVQR